MPNRTRVRALPLLLAFAALPLALPTANARPRPGQAPLPKWETDAEKARNARPHKNASFRNSHPALYGRTEAPVTPVSFYAEFAPTSHIYYTWWPGYHDDFFLGITSAVAQHGSATVVFVVEDAAHQTDIAAELVSHSIPTTDITYIDISGYPYYDGPWSSGPIDSYWMVDYGPFWVADGANTLAIIDPRYYEDRTNDDGLPAKLADHHGLSTFRPDLNLEGGNLMSDGAGTCVLTAAHLVRNLALWPYEVDEILYDYFGCEQVIWLEPLVGEGTGHVDMFAKWLSPTTIILGEYTSQQDAENAAILNENALRLSGATNTQGQALNVVRIPMPDQGSNWFGTIWRTYTNSIVVNGVVVVPTYADETSNEAAALAVYQTVLPSATVIGVDSDSIIPEGGAIHCVTRTRPTGAASPLETPPASSCTGAWDCPPTGCGELDETGICVTEIAAFCDGGEVGEQHCEGDEVCGWDLDGHYVSCVATGCGQYTAQGSCVVVDGAEFAVWCDGDGYPRVERCMSFQSCGNDTTLGRSACLDTPRSCTHECSTEETGCSTDAAQSWTCGEAGDGDDCLEPIHTPCDSGEVCSEGACGCDQECDDGETGCSADGSQSWTCGEVGDGDDCRERIHHDCGAGNGCTGGRCTCADECAAEETGCASDLSAEWSCGEAGDGDDCLDRVPRSCPSGEICRENGCEPEKRPLSPGGCGCHTGRGGGAGTGLLLLLTLGLVLGRRRPH